MIQRKLEELLQKEQYANIEKSWKERFIQDVGLEALKIIQKEKSNTREDTIVYSVYEKIADFIKEELYLNSNTRAQVQSDYYQPEELTNAFLKDVKVLLIQDLQSQAEREQIILVPRPFENYATLIKSASMLKAHFQLIDDDIKPSAKFKM